MTHPGNVPHLVYVRRKPDAETTRASVTRTPAVNNEAPQKQGDVKAQALPALGSPPVPTPAAKSPSNMLTPAAVKVKQWEARVSQFNNILDKLDQSDQKDYIQMLRSLSSIELSKQAVELENKAIQLSINEAKEIQRVQILDVLERYSKHS